MVVSLHCIVLCRRDVDGYIVSMVDILYLCMIVVQIVHHFKLFLMRVDIVCLCVIDWNVLIIVVVWGASSFHCLYVV